MSEWQPIETAPMNSREFLAVCYIGQKMTKEPFISFWSPTLGKYYANPTHWMPLPPAPESKP